MPRILPHLTTKQKYCFCVGWDFLRKKKMIKNPKIGQHVWLIRWDGVLREVVITELRKNTVFFKFCNNGIKNSLFKENLYETEEDAKKAKIAKRKNEIDDIKSGIHTIEDLVVFLYQVTASSLEEYDPLAADIAKIVTEQLAEEKFGISLKKEEM